MNEKFLVLIASGLAAFGKILELFPTILFVANIFSGNITDTIFFAENLEEEFV